MVVVLDGRKLLVQLAHVVIVYQGYGAHDQTVRRLPGSLHELIANEIAKCLRPVGVPAASDEPVKSLQQVAVDCHADPAQPAHWDMVAPQIPPRGLGGMVPAHYSRRGPIPNRPQAASLPYCGTRPT